MVFNERRNVALASDIPVNAVGPYPAGPAPIPEAYTALADLQNLTIPAGAVVNSHFLHIDTVGTGGRFDR